MLTGTVFIQWATDNSDAQMQLEKICNTNIPAHVVLTINHLPDDHESHR